MQIYVNVPLKEAVKRGSAKHGLLPVDVPLDSLTESQREILAWLVEEKDGRVLLRETHRGYTSGLGPVANTPEATPEHVLQVLENAVAYKEERAKEAAERKEREHQEEAERRAEAEQQARLPVSEQVRIWGGVDKWIPVSPLGDYDDLRGPAAEEAARRTQLAKEEAERQQAARKAAEAAAEDERAAWIEQHGSVRLKRLVKEGIEHKAVYRDERLAKERPGWRTITSVPGGYEEPRNPPMAALELLDEARQVDKDAQLVYWTIDHECSDECCYEADCPKYDWSGYVAIADFDPIDDVIVYGGPEA